MPHFLCRDICSNPVHAYKRTFLVFVSARMEPSPNASHRRDDSAVQTFFATSQSPTDYEECKTQLQAFLNVHTDGEVAVISSGGTAVPLERAAVRFIDNFSSGARGAALAERLAGQGYAVVFLYRRGSKRPFVRHMLDTIEQTTGTASLSPDALSRAAVAAGEVARHLTAHAGSGLARLLAIPYTSVEEYLWKLRLVTEAVGPRGSRTLLVLAAAVSDFWLPPGEVPDHKIQSDAVAGPGGSGVLTLALHPVPKVLHMLKSAWAPSSLVVSFKLETDPALLIAKAGGALLAAGVDAVVANLLPTRYTEVTVLARDEGQAVETPSIAGCSIEARQEAVPVAYAPQPLPVHMTRIKTTGQAAQGQVVPDQPLEDALAAVLAALHKAHATKAAGS